MEVAFADKIYYYHQIMVSPIVWSETILPDGSVVLEPFLGEPEPYWALVEEVA